MIVTTALLTRVMITCSVTLFGEHSSVVEEGCDSNDCTPNPCHDNLHFTHFGEHSSVGEEVCDSNDCTPIPCHDNMQCYPLWGAFQCS